MNDLKVVTFLIPIIRDDLITDCLDSIYKHTDPLSFSVIVIDQTISGLDKNLRDRYKNLTVIRTPKSDMYYTGNLGFAKATNMGAKLVTTPYMCFCNDDVIFIHPGWWEGIMATFKMVEKATPERPAITVNAASFVLADWSVGKSSGDHHWIIPYKQEYTNEDWDYLINEEHYVNEHLTIKPKSVFDGVTLYASVIDTKKFREVGPLDERYYYGGGEDYDYSCLTSMRGYRSVSTTLSWVLHHWSKSFQSVRDEDDIKLLAIPELNWNHNHEKWGPNFDIWGVKCQTCKEILHSDDGLIAECPNGHETYEIPQNTDTPL